MISTRFDSKSLNRDLENIVKYSFGFIDGVQLGKTRLMHILAAQVIEGIKQYIDSNARVNPEALHHVYEWYQTGSPNARLFDIEYTVSGIGLSIMSSFSQSTSIKQGSKVPFYDKARMMEAGVSAVVKPRNAEVLAFEVDGQKVFTPNPVRISNVGGPETTGQFEKVFDSFFSQYFTQAFLRMSGILNHLSNPSIYKRDFPAGRRLGRPKGLSAGFRWVTNFEIGR